MSKNIEIVIDFNIDMGTYKLGVNVDDADDYLPTHSLIFDLQESSTLFRSRVEAPIGNTLEWLWSNL